MLNLLNKHVYAHIPATVYVLASLCVSLLYSFECDDLQTWGGITLGY